MVAVENNRVDVLRVLLASAEVLRHKNDTERVRRKISACPFVVGAASVSMVGSGSIAPSRIPHCVSITTIPAHPSYLCQLVLYYFLYSYFLSF
jgi:hypothetical protein